ncbi:MAG: family 10 glycosylhydrolase [Oscillospiraceae bacterium]
MKKIISILLMLILLSSCTIAKNDLSIAGTSAEPKEETQKAEENKAITKAIWINFNELSMKNLSGGNEQQFRQKAEEMVNNIKDFGLNTIIMQVRPFSDALYKSEIFPYSSYLTGTQGQKVDYDPLAIMIEIAKKSEISVEAWINPYRVLLSNNFDLLADSNPAKKWHNEQKDENLIILPNGIFYNPCSKDAQKLIVDGVREIVKNYDVSAIHLDDYFYPSTDEAIDKTGYEVYLSEGGHMSLSDWRRENVNAVISGIYTAIKSIKKDVKLTISPSGDIAKNRDNLYADVEKWCSEKGYIDTIMPQLYYGFNNSSKPFEETAKEWISIIKNDNIKICFGLSFYKSDKEDAYAGKGKNEWIERNDICSRQVTFLKGLTKYDGFSIFSYSHLFSEKRSENVNKEYNYLKNVV